MADDRLHDDVDDVDESPILPHRRMKDSVDLDITPMIDIVFLLLIFFLVASVPDPQVAADLPRARHGKGVDKLTSVIITIKDLGDGQAEIYLGNGKKGDPLPDAPADQQGVIRDVLNGVAVAQLPDDAELQQEIIRRTVAAGNKDHGKTSVLVKAEKGVPYRMSARVASAVGSSGVEGMGLNFAVVESE